MSDFKKGQRVLIRDYPFGKALNVRAEVIGVLRDDFYNVRILNGIREGDIVKYRAWKLLLDNSVGL